MSASPNILFLLSDEHSFRAMGHVDAREGEPVSTPNFDALAAGAVNFHTTYCQTPLCTPSRICLLAGLSPMGSDGWDNGSEIAPDRPTVASTLRQAGYSTCLVGKMHLGGNRQFAGFEHRPYGDLTGHAGHQPDPLALGRKGGMAIRSRTADAGVTTIPESLLQEQVVNRESIAFLREQRHRRPGQPWFLCASYSRPHFPLTSPRRHFDRYWPRGVTPPKVGRTGDTADHPMTQGMAASFQTEAIDQAETIKARAAYFANVSYLDEIVGDLLATLQRDGLLENTIVVYTSDHGELMGEHGLWGKNSWHEGSARVPWMVQLPEHRAGRLPAKRIDTPVSLADHYPTLCGLAGVTAPGDLDGLDLASVVRGRADAPRRPIFCVNPTPRWGKGTEHVLVRDGRYKYVRFRHVKPDLMFDLQSDPLEQRNLLTAGDTPRQVQDEADRLQAEVTAWWDFDAAETKRAAVGHRSAEHRLPNVHGTNAYHMPDGRIVAADTPLYEPALALENPAGAIADWPGERPAIP